MKRKLEDVFKTVGLPPYTYVKPTYYGEVKADIVQAGKHLLIEGPSGIGKTCVIFKVFEELGWEKGPDYLYTSARDESPLDVIHAFIGSALTDDGGMPSRLVVDDFHLFDKSIRSDIGSSLKRMSDQTF